MEDECALKSLTYMLFNLTVPISAAKIENVREVFKKDHQTRLLKTRKEWKFKRKYPEKEPLIICVGARRYK